MRNKTIIFTLGICGIAQYSLAQPVPQVGSIVQSSPKPYQSNERKIEIVEEENDKKAAVEKSYQNMQLEQGEIPLHSIQFQHDLTLVSEEELLDQVTEYYDRTYKLSELKSIADKLTLWLQQEKGLVKAKAWIPLQEVQNGQLKINIQEGKRGAIRISNNLKDEKLERVSAQFASKFFEGQDALEQRSLERFAYRLIDYLGQPVQLVLMPTKEIGVYDVLLHFDQQQNAFGSVTVDNVGSPYTNQWRDMSTLYLMHPFGTAGQLTFSTQALTEHQKTAYLRYQIPLLSSWKIGLEGQISDYELCCEFTPLDIEGTSSNVGLDAFYTLIRSRELSHWVGIRANYWQGRSKAFDQVTSDRNIYSFTLENQIYWSNIADHSLQLQFTGGHATLDHAADQLMDRLTTRISGDFFKINSLYALRYPFLEKNQIYINLNGQVSSKNLDSSEKISAGGLSGIRAYAYGEALSDSAILSQFEYRYHIFPSLSVGAFYDLGYVQRQRNAWANMGFKNEYDLQGAGLKLQWKPHKSLDLQLLSAAQIGQNPNEDINGKDSDGKSQDIRTWFVGTWSF